MADAVGAIRVNVAAMTGQFDAAMKAAAVTATSTGAAIAAQATQFKTLDEAMAHTAKVAKELRDVTRAGGGLSEPFGNLAAMKMWGKEAQGVFASTRTDLEKYQAQMERLKAVQAKTGLDPDTVKRQSLAYRKEYLGSLPVDQVHAGAAKEAEAIRASLLTNAQLYAADRKRAKELYEGKHLDRAAYLGRLGQLKEKYAVPLPSPPKPIVDTRTTAAQALQGQFASFQIPGTGFSLGSFGGMTGGAAGVVAAVATIAIAWKGVEAAIGLAKGRWDEINANAKQARNIGTDVESLEKLKYAGMRTGIDEEAMVTAAVRLQAKIGEAMESGPELDKFKRLGLDPFALSKMDPTEAFDRVRDAISGFGTDAQRMAAAKELFGKSAIGMSGIWRETRAGLDAFEKRRQKLEPEMSAADVATIRKASIAWTDFEIAKKAAFTKLDIALAPHVEELAKQLTAAALAAEKLLSNASFGETMAAGFKAAGFVVRQLTSDLEKMERIMTFFGGTAKNPKSGGFDMLPGMEIAYQAGSSMGKMPEGLPSGPMSTESMAAAAAGMAAVPLAMGARSVAIFGPIDKLTESWNKTAEVTEKALSLQSRYGSQAQQMAAMLMELDRTPQARNDPANIARRAAAFEAMERTIQAARATAIADFSRDAGRQLSLPIGIETSAVEEKFKEMIRTLALTAEQQLKLRPTVDALAAREAGEKLLAALPQTSMAREAKVTSMRNLVERYEAGLPKTGSAMRPEDELSKAGRRNIGLAALGYNAESLTSPMAKFTAQMDEVKKRIESGDLSKADAGAIIVREQDKLASTARPLQLPSAAAYGSQEAYNVIAKSQVQSDPKVQLAREANKILTDKLGAIEGLLKEIKDARDQVNNVPSSP